MDKPKVSVIIPVYNAELYIGECIDSVLAQTISDIEVILVDDGSKDASVRICDAYAVREERVRAIHQENTGVAAARNTGIEAAWGEYLAFIDADDLFAEDYLEKLLLEIEKNSAVLAYGEIVRFSDNSLPQKNMTDNLCRCGGAVEELENIIKNNKFVSVWRCLMVRHVIKKNNLRFETDRAYGEDLEFVYKYMVCCDKIVYVPNAVYFYRRYSSSAMGKASYRQFDSVRAMQSVESFAEERLKKEDYEKLHRGLYAGYYIHFLHVAIDSLLIGKEHVRNIKKYLKDQGFDRIILDSNVDKSSPSYGFWRLYCLMGDKYLLMESFRIFLSAKKQSRKSG